MRLNALKQEIKKLSDRPRAKFLQRFFKTGRGGYAAGDKFLGLRVPDQRILARKYKDLDFTGIKKLLLSPFHEERLIGLLILTYKYPSNPKKVFSFYRANTSYVNNWDLVDSSAHKIVGEYLLDKKPALLYKFAKSKNFWKRRIAMVATYQFIRNNKYKETIKVAEMLLGDKHDLIHKAVGWMLREMGKRNEKILLRFLDKYYRTMPRTALRYAIERLSSRKRRQYLGK